MQKRYNACCVFWSVSYYRRSLFSFDKVRLLKRQAIHCILMELNSWAAERSGHTLTEVITLLRDNDYCFFVVQQGRLQALDNVHLSPDGDVVVIPTARLADARQLSLIA